MITHFSRISSFTLLVSATVFLLGCQQTSTNNDITLQQGAAERTSAPEMNGESGYSSSLADATEEEMAEIEENCEGARQGHILHCGMSTPEGNFECRTTQADQVYRECVASAILKDMLGEESPNAETENSMNH